jgi:uncharacterized delta-60 repeat protein
MLTFGLSNGFGRTTLCYLGFCVPYFAGTVRPDGGYSVVGHDAFVRTPALAQSVSSTLGNNDVSNINNVQGSVDARAIAVQADGKVLAGGYGYVSQADATTKLGVVRFASSGFSLDPTFTSTAGEVVYSGGAVISVADNGGRVTDILVRPDGRIVLVGFAFQSSTQVLALARLNSNGTPDVTFGTGGAAAFALPSGLDHQGNGLAKLDRAGGIVVPIATAQGVILVARVASSGSLDSNFGPDHGFATVPPPAACKSINANAVDIDSAGRILVTGDCAVIDGITTYFIVVRIRGDSGLLDTSFGIGGYGLGAFDPGSASNSASTVAFDGSGHPIVGGATQSYAGVSRLTYDLIYTNNFELAPRGCLPPACN